MASRNRRLSGQVGTFLRQYKRKSHSNWTPNDRQYDREVEESVKNMDPSELSDLIAGYNSEDITNEEEQAWWRGDPIHGVEFSYGDSVLLADTSGKYTEAAQITDLIRVRPQPEYEAVLSNGEIRYVYQTRMQRSATNDLPPNTYEPS